VKAKKSEDVGSIRGQTRNNPQQIYEQTWNTWTTSDHVNVWRTGVKYLMDRALNELFPEKRTTSRAGLI
jgi:hypothetical protein